MSCVITNMYMARERMEEITFWLPILSLNSQTKPKVKNIYLEKIRLQIDNRTEHEAEVLYLTD